MNIGGVLVNLDNVNYAVQSPNDPSCLLVHMRGEVVCIEKLSMEEINTVLNAIVVSKSAQ